MELSFAFAQDTASARAAGVQDAQRLTLGLPNPLLAGGGGESWYLPGPGEIEQHEELIIWRGSSGMVGIAAVEVTAGDLEAAAARLYAAILNLTDDYVLHRFWNFVPQINAAVGELDRYMCFCVGRANAFAGHSKPFQGAQLPPASAVGTTGHHLCVAFLAGRETLVPVENPLQVPAYQYPQRYGPRAPSFARAGIIETAGEMFISGTASIRASESLHAGDFVCQAQTAIENLAAVSEAAGHPHWLDAAQPYQRTVRVYVKRAELWHQHGEYLQKHLLDGVQHFNVIEADICRPELLVEIEAHTARHTGGPTRHMNRTFIEELET